MPLNERNYRYNSEINICKTKHVLIVKSQAILQEIVRVEENAFKDIHQVNN